MYNKIDIIEIYVYMYIIIYIYIYICTGWTILIHPVEYLENQARERKIFQIKVVWFQRGHKMIPLV